MDDTPRPDFYFPLQSVLPDSAGFLCGRRVTRYADIPKRINSRDSERRHRASGRCSALMWNFDLILNRHRRVMYARRRINAGSLGKAQTPVAAAARQPDARIR